MSWPDAGLESKSRAARRVRQGRALSFSSSEVTKIVVRKGGRKKRALPVTGRIEAGGRGAVQKKKGRNRAASQCLVKFLAEEKRAREKRQLS